MHAGAEDCAQLGLERSPLLRHSLIARSPRAGLAFKEQILQTCCHFVPADIQLSFNELGFGALWAITLAC